jgi:Flp pilus assembly protein TadG
MRLRVPTSRPVVHYRRGKILIICAVLFPVLLGLVGLVIDGGRLMAAHRQAQNAADAGARAAALALQQTPKTATQAKLLAAANAVVLASSSTPNNGLPDGVVTVHWPPSVSAYYSGDTNFVECVINYPITTVFIQVLGIAKTQTATARAVAGLVDVPSTADVILLDPTASPGLSIQGTNASLAVTSGIQVSSLMNGVTTVPVQPGVLTNGSHNAAEAGGGSPTPVTALFMRVSGGVDSISNFDNNPPYNAGPPPSGGVQKLDAGTADPPYDPLIGLPTPIITTGPTSATQAPVVVNQSFGKVQVNSGTTKTLSPGIYNDITIQAGATVTFNPGIYVLNPSQNNQGLTINGGTATGKGVMFYVTGKDYTPSTGAPDTADNSGAVNSVPVTPNPANTKFATVSFTGSPTVNLTPIDTTQFKYTDTGIAGTGNDITSRMSVFNQMLFYQRRWNTNTITINSSPVLQGNIYAQWANFSLAGNGRYDFAIVVGSMSVNGDAVVTVPPAGGFTVKNKVVYLVE